MTTLRRPRGAMMAMLTVGLMFVACTRSTLLHRYQPVGQQGWARTDTLSFTLPDVSTEGDYELAVGLRYGNVFPYEGIWVVAETRLVHPNAFHRDTLYLATADDDGRPLGQGISMDQREVSLSTLHLHKGQSGTVRLRHIMTREVVPNISDVGLRVAIP